MALISPDTMKKVIQDALSPSPSAPLLPSRKHTTDGLYGTSSYNANRELDNDHQPTTPLNSSYYILEPSSSPYQDGVINQDTPDTARILFSSPIRLSPPQPGREQRYEVEHSFLQAIAGLIERQANIVPASTLTKQDVKKMIRKELDARQQADSTITVEDGQNGGSASVVTMPVVLSATAAGATAVVLIRAGKMYPEEMKWFFGGAVKGGVLGFASTMVVKGVLAGLDWLNGSRDRAGWADV